MKEFYEGTLTEPWRNDTVSSDKTLVTIASVDTLVNCIATLFFCVPEGRGFSGIMVRINKVT